MIQRHLEPGESLSEILFGLVMTLTFTLGAGILVREDPSAARELLIATIGCNVAWGIIDAAFYVSGNVFERARLARVGQKVRAAPSEEVAAAVLADELSALIDLTVAPGDRPELYQRMARHVRATPASGPWIGRTDFYGAFASFWLVFFSSIPAAVPFLFVANAWIALRISNAILVSMLFIVGWRWARHTTLRPWLTGLTFLVAGIALVAMAIALGG